MSAKMTIILEQVKNTPASKMKDFLLAHVFDTIKFLLYDMFIFFFKDIPNFIKLFPIIPEKGQISIILNIFPLLLIISLYTIYLNSIPRKRKDIISAILISILISFFIPMILYKFVPFIIPRYDSFLRRGYISRWMPGFIAFNQINFSSCYYLSTISYTLLYIYFLRSIVIKWKWLRWPYAMVLSSGFLFYLLFGYWYWVRGSKYIDVLSYLIGGWKYIN